MQTTMLNNCEQHTSSSEVLFLEVCKFLGIEKSRTTPYHPQGDGIIERSNRTIQTMLRSYLDPAHCNTWDDHLPLIQFAYNSSRHTATELTPHYVLFGREARLPLDLMCPMPDAALRWVPPMSYVIDLRKRLEAAYQHVKQHLNFAQCRAKLESRV